MGYSPWGPKESDTTERLHFTSVLNDSGNLFLDVDLLGSEDRFLKSEIPR